MMIWYREPPLGGLIARGVAKYSDFGPIEGYISEKVQHRRAVYTYSLIYVQPVYTGVFLTPVYTARIYGPYLQVVRTGHPYIWPVYTARKKQQFYTGSVYRAPVYTGRIYGCIFDTRTYGPHVRVVRTGHPYIRPVQKKHCSQCFSAVWPVYTGSVYRAPVYTGRICGPYRAVEQKLRPITID